MGMLRIAFIVAATLLMFGAVFAYSSYVHGPIVAGLCASTCAKQNMKHTLQRKGYNRSASTGCLCIPSGGEAKGKPGYFLVPVEFLDWFLMIWVRLIPLAIILGVCVFIMAKIVTRIPGG